MPKGAGASARIPAHSAAAAARKLFACIPRRLPPAGHFARFPLDAGDGPRPCYSLRMVFGKEQIVRNGAEANALMSEVFAMQSADADRAAACPRQMRNRAHVAGYSYRFC